MDLQILLGLLLTITPVIELRGGLPIVVEWSLRNNVSVTPYFFMILFLNIILIFFIFFFLDFIHEKLLWSKMYRKSSEPIFQKIRRKGEKIEQSGGSIQYILLALFVSIPLPGTGVWGGTILSWSFGLNRIRSIVAIAFGTFIAALIVLFASLGIFLTIS
jgi:uncharacterized membrane protein